MCVCLFILIGMWVGGGALNCSVYDLQINQAHPLR